MQIRLSVEELCRKLRPIFGKKIDQVYLKYKLAEDFEAKQEIEQALNALYHKHLDKCSEKLKGKNKIGTTGRGVGPAYSDKVNRIGIRVIDLVDKQIFKEKLKKNIDYYNKILSKIYNDSPINYNEVLDNYLSYAQVLKPYVDNVSFYLFDLIDSKTDFTLVFEGAQGTLLDIDYGTYPYVTSSNPTLGGIYSGSGIGNINIDKIIGIVKSYTTRVGEGPFPTELNDDVGLYLREVGKEFGATTGRSRRCGWLDIPILKYAVNINRINSLVLTKIDVLTGLQKILICTGYKKESKVFNYFVNNQTLLQQLTPIYEEFEGWNEDITEIKDFNSLPENCKKYIKKIEDLVKVPIDIISTGPDRYQTIQKNEFF